ncbi:MAG: hypothetical protein KDM63_14150, partial [Verrucomicrobiae bacterium]|nr:hypothetical protein [Verrucomicrobiae bacterium]
MNPSHSFLRSLATLVVVALSFVANAEDGLFPAHLSRTFQQGDEISGDPAPDCGNRAFRVTGSVSAAKGDGVLASQGGVVNGWAVTVEKGHLVASIRSREALHRFVSEETVPEKFSFRFELDADGRASLFLDNKSVGGGQLPGLLPGKPGDPLIIGADSKAPVGDYSSPFRYLGKIESVTVALAFPRPESDHTYGEMKTRWAAQVDPEHPRPEYPRPQMVRSQWENLNGRWDYAIVDRGAGKPENWDGKIVVPFAAQSQLS